MTVDKRLVSMVSPGDAVDDSDTNHAGVFSFSSFTLPSLTKPRATTKSNLTFQQEMGGCISRPIVAERVHAGIDGGLARAQPIEQIFEPTSSPKRTATPPFEPSCLLTPEPEAEAQHVYSHPEMPVIQGPNITPPSTVRDTSNCASLQMPDPACPESNASKPSASAGSRFWEMLQNERPDHKERFFEDVFNVQPMVGGKVNSHVIRPYYRQGMMAGYIRTGESDVVKQANININKSAVLVNQEFRAAGSRLTYGSYLFYFEDPINCLWWLKHIGRGNSSNVRRLECTLRCGWPDISQPDLTNFDQSQEELWHRVFCYLKPRHQLTDLALLFNTWGSVDLVCRDAGAPEYRQEELAPWRDKLRDVLHNFRGLKNALIIDHRRVAFSVEERAEFTMMMIQDRLSVYPPPPPQQRLTLALFLEKRRSELRVEEAAAVQKSRRAQENKRKRQDKDEGENSEQQDVEMDGCGA
ncbi:hypothetical protein G647_09392 [Cladophialophora carrionii CBS 160.54]|uniref:Uncharacterized protein n=1 Tax=Cladophialophora carrionii CBS 160.54 TaxID=1279043 RepID=V9CZV6_9EURO|nr:uncharacterized protein G647_09392 [Cladophialophora carrionii CBS 160.54]ETI19558.1 hypothetical protein G647_09392 [Cladophialophora carrionii CBS 160.54]